MQVRLEVQFKQPTAEDKRTLRSVACAVTDHRQGVRIFAKPGTPDWLVTEFTMTPQAQYHATAQIERSLRFCLEDRMDLIIMFPKSEEERQYAKRKAERRRANRAAQRARSASDKPKGPRKE